MKILHTADWHLGATWDGQSRRADQERVLDEVLHLCDEHDVDLLLVAGDVLHDRVEGGHPAAVLRRLLLALHPHFKRGRAVFLLRGNHDPLDLFQLMTVLSAEIGAGTDWPLVVADQPGVYALPGHATQVVALPYLTPRMLQNRVADLGASPEAQVAGAAGLLGQLIEDVYRDVRPDAPSIFAGHVLIGGTQPTSDVEGGYSREIWLDPARLPHFTSYNALGHIHLGQEVRGTSKPTRYPGALDRLNLGERDYSPAVLLVETPDTPGGAATVQPLSLSSCTRFVRVGLDGAQAVEEFCVDVQGNDPLGVVEVLGISVESRGAIESQVHGAAPRLRIQWPVQSITVEGEADAPDHRDVHATVVDYLTRAYAEQPARRDQLVSAFEVLWSEESEGVRS